MIDRMTEGDTVVIESLSRLGRSTRNLIELTELFRSKGVHLNISPDEIPELLAYMKDVMPTEEVQRNLSLLQSLIKGKKQGLSS